MADMSSKYAASKFDPNDPNDRVAERARKAILAAYKETITDEDNEADRELEYILAGLLVGVTQVMQAIATENGDQTDAAIRASIIQMTPWAVDMARSFKNRPPLSDAN